MKDINFFRFHGFFLTISLLCVIGMLVLFGMRGFNYGTDFNGGVEAIVTIDDETLTVESLRQSLEAEGIATEIQEIVTRENTYIIRFEVDESEESIGGTETSEAGADDVPLTTNNLLLVGEETAPVLEETDEVTTNIQTPVSKLKKALAKQYGETVTILQSRLVGSILSSENKTNAISISIVVIILIVGYLTMRFELPLALAAIFAVIYDVSIILGFVLLLGNELNILTIVSILTIFGYSVNDTIVLFDRIREEKAARIPSDISGDYRTLVNFSINRVLGRTLITSMTTLVVVFSLYVSTSGDYKAFSLTLIIGLISGTYSSIVIAPGFLFFWHRYVRDLLIAKKAKA